RERVHDRCEHAHLVCRYAVHAGPGEAGAAEDVAPAHHRRDVHAHLGDIADLPGDALEHGWIDAVIAGSHERLAGELHEDARVGVGCGCAHRLETSRGLRAA